MKYTVVWTPVAERRLTELWLGSRMRYAMQEAADAIDVALGKSPSDCGESRDGRQRIFFREPLGVLFEIIEGNRQVRVLSVWQC
jgi:hypothetical protein